MIYIILINLYLILNYIPYSNCITNGRIVFDPTTASSVALVQTFRRSRAVRSHGYRSTNECTGSLISSQVVITAGHCIKGWKGHGLLVKFLNRRKLLLFRRVKASRVFHQTAGVDLAILLLHKPITVCDPEARYPFEIFLLPFKGLYNWTDKSVENAKCSLFGFGKNEKSRHLDYELRSMPVRLKAESPNLTTALLTNQKICEVNEYS
ncbi:unnamed protein product [Enterobius vermicularis]|uniref:Peptidase S1 domain-containing protein n=1 Tax=Enterobius vermicularis TaxID=51028 RepID=A0A0N4VQW9_ENTVE|nr:unnamed protein product [Enterobius vermicularis]